MSNEGSTISRRDLIHVGGAFAAAALVPAAALATPETMARSMSEALGDVAPKSGRVKLDISPLAENGNAVPVTIIDPAR